MNRWASLSVLAGLAAIVGIAAPGEAQVEQGRFDVGIGAGAVKHPNSSGFISTSPLLNLQTRMLVTENIGLGFLIDYARTETDDDIFPLAQFRFLQADSTTLVALLQPLTLFHYQFIGTIGTSRGESVYAYLMGGIGGYTIYLDPQSNDAAERQSDLAFSFGGAVKLRISGSAGIELGVRDVVYTGFDRDRLDPTPDRTCRESGERQFSGTVCPNERFRFLDPEFSDPNWSGPTSTVHNIVFLASFSFIPGL